MSLAPTTTSSTSATTAPQTIQPRARHGAKAVAANVIWNWAGIIVTMGTGVVIAPFLIHRLGESIYGLWILIAALTGYFGLLDLGIRGSVGRYIAFHRAQQDFNAVNAVLNTALVLLCGVAGVACLATLISVWLFPHVFEIPAGYHNPARIALLIVGLNLALTFPVAIFDSVLWALQRFDLLNIVDIPVGILRTVLVFYFIGRGDGLIALANIAIAMTALAAVIKAIMSFWIEPQLRLNLRFAGMATARKIYGYGIWSFLLAAAREGRGQLSPVLIGALLNVSFVTVYSIASRLIGYATQFVIASTGVLTPVATTLHAQEKNEQQQKLFVEGGKYCSAVALYFALLFIVLGRSLIRVWVGPELVAQGAGTLLDILVIGEIIPMSQWVTYSMILGMARHKLSAWVAVVEVIIMVVLMVLLVKPMGLVGVCLAVAVAGFLCRGIFQVIYGCHLMRVSVWRYSLEALLRPTVLAVVLGAALWLAADRHAPDTWLKLFIYGTVFSLLYFGIALVALGGYDHARAYLERKRKARATVADETPAIDAVPGV
jgi:O-antigen/teichoic acid export membrane protein